MRSSGWVSISFVAGLVLFPADSPNARPEKRPPEGPLITVHAPHPQRFELSLDEIVFDWSGHPGAPAQSAVAIPGARVVEREIFLALIAVTRASSPVDLLTMAQALRAANPGAEAHLVLYSPGPPKTRASRGLLTRKVGLMLEQGADPLNVVAGLALVAIRPMGVTGGYLIAQMP